MKPGWTEDSDGLWYQGPTMKRRARGRWAVCVLCSERFPAFPSHPGRYCSKRCSGKDNGRPPASRADLFEHWTPEECWLAGLLWADGHLDAEQRVQLNLTDEEAIRHAAEIAGCSYRTYAAQARDDGWVRKPLHRLSFSNRVSVPRLTAIGFGQKPLEWPEIPHPASFLRGAFDGDGSVLLHQQGGRRKTPNSPLRLHSTLCGTLPFLEGTQDFLAAYGISLKKIGRNGTIWQVQWNHADSIRLAGVIYSEPGPYLSRKRDIFAQKV